MRPAVLSTCIPSRVPPFCFPSGYPSFPLSYLRSTLALIFFFFTHSMRGAFRSTTLLRNSALQMRSLLRSLFCTRIFALSSSAQWLRSTVACAPLACISSPRNFAHIITLNYYPRCVLRSGILTWCAKMALSFVAQKFGLPSLRRRSAFTYFFPSTRFQPLAISLPPLVFNL